MLSAGKAGNEYIGNWNQGTFLILQEYQIHSHHPALPSDWNLSLVTILHEVKQEENEDSSLLGCGALSLDKYLHVF
jgi:hypothetical protein